MIPWKLGLGHPLSLTIAADARLSKPNYINDQIWKLSLNGGEPAALALQTTFGLRARSMRLFPRFYRAGQSLVDPAQYYRPPQVERFYPNYLSVRLMPFADLNIQAEYWCPDSCSVLGRMTVQNQGIEIENLLLEWAALLNPLGEGHGMVIASEPGSHTLQGRTADLYPVCLLSGAPSPSTSSYPALAVDLELAPKATQAVTWVFTALDSLEGSLASARQWLAYSWEADLARIELQNAANGIEIETGDPDWNAAFALSQKVAFGLFFPAGDCLPYPSFVINREPEQGYSIRGNGSDYPYLWNGQTAFDSFYLSQVLLPGAPDLLKGLVRNFLSAQTDNGEIDWKPGLAGQRSQRTAQPLVATLAGRILRETGEDPAFAREVFPGLMKFLATWFTPNNDRDQDGLPEWAHPLQSGMEDTPLFDRWHPASQGLSVTAVESPALAAMLLSEVESLLELANQIDESEALPWLQARREQLAAGLQSTWDDKGRRFQYLDYQTHQSRPSETLLQFEQPGSYPVEKRWRVPRRLLLRLSSQEQSTYLVHIVIHGDTPEGPVAETINTGAMTWTSGQGRYTSQHVFTRLHRIEIQAQVQFTGTLATVDYSQEDISLLLPLWIGAATREQADVLIHATLLPHLLQPFGIAFYQPRPGDEDRPAPDVSLPWLSLVIEGLLRYGCREEAATIYSRLMQAVVDSLKENQCFRATYHPVTGAGSGEANSLRGLAPLLLFLKTAGIECLTPDRVVLTGKCPFPWPIKVKFRGIAVQWKGDQWKVTFRSGQSISVEGTGRQTVSLR